jgi:hypothetical protein
MTLRLAGSTSGYTEIDAPAVAGSNTLVLPTGNGSSGQFLQTNGSGALSWAGAGKILQVAQAAKSDKFTTTSTSFTTITGLEVTITPTSTTSKILVTASVVGSQDVGTNDCFIGLFRGSTQIALGDADGSRTRHSFALMQSDAGWTDTGTVTFLDSPATTSATTYSVRVMVQASGTVFINRSDNNLNAATGGGSPFSSITVMEVAA